MFSTTADPLFIRTQAEGHSLKQLEKSVCRLLEIVSVPRACRLLERGTRQSTYVYLASAPPRECRLTERPRVATVGGETFPEGCISKVMNDENLTMVIFMAIKAMTHST